MLLALISSIPVVLAMDLVTQDLVTPAKQFGEACGYEICKSLREDTLNVHIVPHTHGELGFTGDFYSHFTGDFGDDQGKTQVNMKRILDHTITELWSDSERRFSLSDMAYFFYWWKQRDGTVHRMVYELIRQGRLSFVGGGFSMSDEATTSYHAIIDMFTYSLGKLNATFLECGRPLVSWQTDVFGHSREFASLMSQMGFGGHFINPISYDDEVARMIAKSMEFVWRGSDDLGPNTDIYTHKLFDGYWSPPGFCFGTYCEDPLMIESDIVFKNIEKRVQDFIKVAVHRQGPYYTTKNIMVIMGQRFGYFDAGVWFSNIDKLIRHVNERSADLGFPVNLFYSSPACYLKAVSEAKPELTTKQDDFLPFAYDQSSMAVGIYTARPTLKFFIRQAHVYLQIAKQLQITAGLVHTKRYDSAMERFKWINSVVQDHNIITGVMSEYTRLYYTHKMFIALQGSTRVDTDGLNKLRKSPANTQYFRCSFNISVCQNTDAEQYYIVVYNPLAWAVTVKVRLPTLKREFIVYHPSGKRVKASMMRIANPVFDIYRRRTHAQHELVFIAEDIPAVGFRSYFIKLKSFGWKRNKRAILKKVNRKHKTKKYLVRQAYQNGITEDSRDDDLGNFDYEYFEGPIRTTPKTKILFGSFEKENDRGTDQSSNDVITPRTRLRNDDSKNANVTKDSNTDISEGNVSLESTEMDNSLINKNIVEFSNDINDTAKDNSSRVGIDKNISLENTNVVNDDLKKTTTDSRRDNVINKTENRSIERIKMNETVDKKVEMFKNYLNKTNDDILQAMRKFHLKNNKKSNLKYVVTTDSAVTETTDDIFSEVDTKPEFIFNINNKTKITDIAQNEIDENKKETVHSILKEKEYAELGISKSDENTNVINKKIPFEQDDELRDRGKMRKIAENTTWNKRKWMGVGNTITTIAPTNEIGNTNKVHTDDAISPSELKDSDFSDITSSDEGKGSKNQSRKFGSIFGSDDEQMRNQMFGIDGRKLQNEISGGEHEKFKNETFGTDHEKWSIVKNASDHDEKIQFIESDLSDDEKKFLKLGTKVPPDNTVGTKIPPDSTGKEKIGESKWDGYDYFMSDDYYIRNRYVKICVDRQKKLRNITLSNGININFNAEMFYYASDDPKKFDRDDRQPGITTFRVMDPRALPINDTYKVFVYKNRIVQELHYEFAKYASFVVRLYRRDPVIELEWQVGPVPIADNIGKEIFIRYTSDLDNGGTFYTDSNGRQTVKRIRNKRPTYEPMNPDYLAGNIYPVTSKIYIEDEVKMLRLAVFNDRAQGGTSLADGEMDLFIHRRILTDDTNRGYLTLNETEHGEGIRVRGKHYIYLTKSDYKPNRIFEKKLAKEIELAPQIFVTKAGPYGLNSKNIWLKQRNEFSALKTKLPIGVHILTLEKWGENGEDLLLRLENYLEKNDALKSGVKKVHLKDIFVNIKIKSIKETSLAGNIWARNARMEKFEWNKKTEFYKNFNEAYGNEANNIEYDARKPKKNFEDADLDEEIVLVPQQIRTFFVTYEYISV